MPAATSLASSLTPSEDARRARRGSGGVDLTPNAGATVAP
jgi:hypothetical protein